MRLKMVVAKRVPSKVVQLAKRFGGAWKYDGEGHWQEVSSERYVAAVSRCSCDYACGSSPRYILYEKGKLPVDVTFEGQPFNLCRGMY